MEDVDAGCIDHEPVGPAAQRTLDRDAVAAYRQGRGDTNADRDLRLLGCQHEAVIGRLLDRAGQRDAVHLPTLPAEL